MHNYLEEEQGTYFYVAAVSEEDRKNGKAAGDVLGFRYLGKNDGGQHVLASVSDSGGIFFTANCSEPCVIIRRSDGTRIAYDPNSIIGAAFQDAINGFLKATTDKASANQVGARVGLATLAEGDWKKIGMGCSCSFTVGIPRQEKLIAGGDGLSFFRLNGEDRLCPAPDIQAMFDGPVSIACGSTSVQVTPFGKVEPGEDGHSSSAQLKLEDASGALSLSGTWVCGC